MYREQLRSFQYLICLILESKPDSKLPQTPFCGNDKALFKHFIRIAGF